MYNNIEEELKNEINILSKEAIGENIEINIGDNILEQGILDSPAIIKLVLFIEKKYKITIEQNEMNINNFESIKIIVEFINNKLD